MSTGMDAEKKATPASKRQTRKAKTDVYAMNKECLPGELWKYGLDAEGTVEELRRRLVSLVSVASQAVAISAGLSKPPAAAETGQPHTPVDSIRPKRYPLYVAAARAPVHLCEVVRNWNVNFDGKTDPVAFLERIEERRESYGITNDCLLQTIPELLEGSALLWVRNNRDAWLG